MNRTKFLTVALLGLASSMATMLPSCVEGGQTVGDADNMPFVAVIQTVGTSGPRCCARWH